MNQYRHRRRRRNCCGNLQWPTIKPSPIQLLLLLLLVVVSQSFYCTHNTILVGVAKAIQITTRSGRLSIPPSPSSLSSRARGEGGGSISAGRNGGERRKVSVATATATTPSEYLQDFIARPMHWPEIVLSSNSVKVVDTTQNNNLGTLPLQIGETVQEYFAGNLLQVDWTCTRNDPGTKLIVESANGLKGIATNCVMDFDFLCSTDDDNDIDNSDGDGVVVQLRMEYSPTSPIAVLATPILIVDNWIALNVLLPIAIKKRAIPQPLPLQSFRTLMGRLYGIAGLAHFFDCVLGDSTLLVTTAGIESSFYNLPFGGQLYALVWCATGPIAYLLSTNNNHSYSNTNNDTTTILGIEKADLGLLLYGIVEIVGAFLLAASMISATTTTASANAAGLQVVYNACTVQVIIFASWIYSYQQQQQQQQKEQQ